MTGQDAQTSSARCLIVDDESPAREELRHMLGTFDDVQVVGEATTAEEAEVLIDSLRYDLVLLDIQMPGIGGLELARRLVAREEHPAIVFTTAFQEHAVEAFDLNVADYLLKPFDEDRLRRAVDRAIELAGAGAGGEDGPAEPAGEVGSAGPSDAGAAALGLARIPVHRGNRVVLVEERQIVWAEAARGYAYLKLPEEKVLASFTLADLEQRLSASFLRTHRSYLANLRYVREVAQELGGGLSLTMADGSRVPVSRRSVTAVRARLGL